MDNNSYYQLFLLFLISLLVYNDAVFSSAVQVRCIEKERQALLTLKQGLEDDSAILSSWSSEEGNKDCCKWFGVECSNTTGHIITLELHGTYAKYLRGELSHSLTELQHLQYLDLSFNDFTGRKMWEVIGSLHRLKYLNLSYSGYTGAFPDQLGNLTSLRTLDLSYNDFKITNLEWLSQLQLLRHLDLSNSQIKATNWVQVIVNLPFLEKLHLSYCGLVLITPSTLLLPNSSSESLSILDISGNFLTSFPTWLFNISKSLITIELSFNGFKGPISETFGEMIFLEDIDLSFNSFEGGIPNSFHNLSHLRSLSLAYNQNLREPFPKMLKKLSKSAEKTLEILDLSYNQFYGLLTGLTRFSSLRELHLSENNLNESLHENFVLPPNLEYFDLSTNQITGKLSTRSWLESDNQTSRLKNLDLSQNQISELQVDITSFSSLEVLLLNNNKLRSIPQSIGQLSKLIALDISSNFLEGTLSEIYFSRQMENLGFLNLSRNQLSGVIPRSIGQLFNLQRLDLSSNLLEGTLSQIDFSKEMEYLESLDLSRNQLSGEIPRSLADLRYISFLNLSYNHLFGKIPYGNRLQTFDASTYIGNSELCGLPLGPCPWASFDPHLGDNQNNNSLITKEFYMSMGFGFIFGLWGVYIFMLKGSWRDAYFRFLKNVYDCLYVILYVNMARVSRMLSG